MITLTIEFDPCKLGWEAKCPQLEVSAVGQSKILAFHKLCRALKEHTSNYPTRIEELIEEEYAKACSDYDAQYT